RGRALAVRLWYGKRSRRYPLSHERAKVTMRWHGGHRRPPRREATSMHRRFTSFVAHVLVACVPVLGLVMAVGAGTASAAHSPVNARAAALAALRHLKIGQHPTNQ